MGLLYRRRRSGPNWAAIASLLLVLGAVAYFVPQYLVPRGSTPAPPLPEPAPAMAAAVAPSPPALAILEQANDLLASGHWASAATQFQRAAELDPQLAAAQAGWARALLFASHSAEALPHAQKAVELDPRGAAFQAVLAQAQDWTGHPDLAVAAARRAMTLDPGFPLSYAYLSEALTDKYQLREADDALSRAVAAGGAEEPEVLRVKGYLQETRADYAGAITSYQEAVKRAPERSYLYIALGQALRTQKQYDEAIQAFQRASELNPDDPRAEGGMGMVYYASENYDAAQGHLERAIQIDPSYANGYGQLGWVFYVQKAYDRAQPYFERAVALEKDVAHNAAYRHALGWIYLNTHQYGLAREQFTQALQEDPSLDGARQGLQSLKQLQTATPTP